MLSIIVPIHNQIGHNELFVQSITQYTTGSYEIIVIDNHSTDGSAKLFEAAGSRVIRNEVNRCYPESMNQGIQAARGEYLCLLNNDVYVGVNWNGQLLEAMEKFGYDAVSPLGIELMPTRALTDWMHGRWAAIGYGRHSGKTAKQLKKLIQLMYGDWERFCSEIYQFFYPRVFEGILGPCVVVKRTLLNKIGLLDEKVQASDWDLYYRIHKREKKVGDVHRVMVVGSSYVHHFIRATVKSRPEPFACTHPRLSIDEKWPRDEQAKLWYKPWDFAPYQPQKHPIIKKVSSRLRKTYNKISHEIMRLPIYQWMPSDPDRVVALYRKQFKTMGLSEDS
jgi:GT2 family glycosyltransferase